jgi:hypothetical protein
MIEHAANRLPSRADPLIDAICIFVLIADDGSRTLEARMTKVRVRYRERG